MSLHCSPLATGSRNKTYVGDRAFSTYFKSARRPRTRRSQISFPAARLVGLYRRLWDSCVSKHIDGQNLEQSNRILKEASRHLTKERDGLQLRHDKQLSRLRFFEQALESSRGRLTCVLDDWNHPSRLNLHVPGFLDYAREG